MADSLAEIGTSRCMSVVAMRPRAHGECLRALVKCSLSSAAPSVAIIGHSFPRPLQGATHFKHLSFRHRRAGYRTWMSLFMLPATSPPPLRTTRYVSLRVPNHGSSGSHPRA
eukprot:6009233-Amphidinium_carterae.3